MAPKVALADAPTRRAHAPSAGPVPAAVKMQASMQQLRQAARRDAARGAIQSTDVSSKPAATASSFGVGGLSQPQASVRAEQEPLAARNSVSRSHGIGNGSTAPAAKRAQQPLQDSTADAFAQINRDPADAHPQQVQSAGVAGNASASALSAGHSNPPMPSAGSMPQQRISATEKNDPAAAAAAAETSSPGRPRPKLTWKNPLKNRALMSSSTPSTGPAGRATAEHSQSPVQDDPMDIDSPAHRHDMPHGHVARVADSARPLPDANAPAQHDPQGNAARAAASDGAQASKPTVAASADRSSEGQSSDVDVWNQPESSSGRSPDPSDAEHSSQRPGGNPDDGLHVKLESTAEAASVCANLGGAHLGTSAEAPQDPSGRGHVTQDGRVWGKRKAQHEPSMSPAFKVQAPSDEVIIDLTSGSESDQASPAPSGPITDQREPSAAAASGSADPNASAPIKQNRGPKRAARVAAFRGPCSFPTPSHAASQAAETDQEPSELGGSHQQKPPAAKGPVSGQEPARKLDPADDQSAKRGGSARSGTAGLQGAQLSKAAASGDGKTACMQGSHHPSSSPAAGYSPQQDKTVQNGRTGQNGMAHGMGTLRRPSAAALASGVLPMRWAPKPADAPQFPHAGQAGSPRRAHTPTSPNISHRPATNPHLSEQKHHMGQARSPHKAHTFSSLHASQRPAPNSHHFEQKHAQMSSCPQTDPNAQAPMSDSPGIADAHMHGRADEYGIGQQKRAAGLGHESPRHCQPQNDLPQGERTAGGNGAQNQGPSASGHVEGAGSLKRPGVVLQAGRRTAPSSSRTPLNKLLSKKHASPPKVRPLPPAHSLTACFLSAGAVLLLCVIFS